MHNLFEEKKWVLRGSNSRPPDYETGALPTALRTRSQPVREKSININSTIINTLNITLEYACFYGSISIFMEKRFL